MLSPEEQLRLALKAQAVGAAIALPFLLWVLFLWLEVIFA